MAGPRAPPHRAAAAGRIGRCGRPPDRPAPERAPWPAGADRKSRGRERHDRDRSGREIAARRLHARHRDLDHPHHRADLQHEATVRSGARLRAGRDRRALALCAGGASRRAGEIRRRADRARQIEAAPAQLFVGRPGEPGPSRGRAVRRHGRHPAQPHSLQELDPCGDRSQRGPHRHAVRHPGAEPRARARGQAARTRDHVRAARDRAARRADHDRVGPAGLRGDPAVRRGAAGRHAGADRGAAQPRGRRRHGDRRGAARVRRTASLSSPMSRPSTSFLLRRCKDVDARDKRGHDEMHYIK